MKKAKPLEEMMSKKELLKKIAKLEFMNDQLETEIGYLDALMRGIGFQEGLTTVKATADEILRQGLSEELYE